MVSDDSVLDDTHDHKDMHVELCSNVVVVLVQGDCDNLLLGCVHVTVDKGSLLRRISRAFPRAN